MDFNKVILAGRATRDAQVTYLPSGTPVVEFCLAVNRYRRDTQGQKQKDVCFIDIRGFGDGAKIAGRDVHKGTEVFIEGQLQQERWQGRDGKKRSKLLVKADSIMSPAEAGETANLTAPDTEQPPQTDTAPEETPKKKEKKKSSVDFFDNYPQEDVENPLENTKGGGGEITDDIPF